MATGVKKIVLAYSGGLDTSIILKWLQETYKADVVAYIADVGQGEETEPAAEKAVDTGACAVHVEDLQAKSSCATSCSPPCAPTPSTKASTSSAPASPAPHRQRPDRRAAQGRRRRRLPRRHRQGQRPGPLRVHLLRPRAERHHHRPLARLGPQQPQRPARLRRKARHRSAHAEKGVLLLDRNLLHISYEGGVLEDPWNEPEEDMFVHHGRSRTRRTNPPTSKSISNRARPSPSTANASAPAALLAKLNDLGGKNGVGRVDLVENRFVGMKSRGVYETPGGTILYAAHRAVESITMDREVMLQRDQLSPKIAQLIYNGFWYAPEIERHDAFVDKLPGKRHRHRPRAPLQRQLRRRRPQIAELALRRKITTFEDDQGAYASRRHRVHPTQRPAPARTQKQHTSNGASFGIGNGATTHRSGSTPGSFHTRGSSHRFGIGHVTIDPPGETVLFPCRRCRAPAMP
jgi:argininosuccinate synthase